MPRSLSPGAPGGQQRRGRSLLGIVPLAAVAALSLCCSDDDQDATPPAATASVAEQEFPNVLDAAVTADSDRFAVSATISSPYDSADRYADAFRVLGPGGGELGVRELTHPHADEQPFTRSLDDLTIPADVASVTVQGRDRANGWGGDTVTVAVPGR